MQKMLIDKDVLAKMVTSTKAERTTLAENAMAGWKQVGPDPCVTVGQLTDTAVFLHEMSARIRTAIPGAPPAIQDDLEEAAVLMAEASSHLWGS